MALHRFGFALQRFLNRPFRVLAVCACFMVMSLVFDGILWRLWGLHRDHERRTSDIRALQEQVVVLDRQLKQARDPAFIERQARDRLDLVGQNDLLFVFPED